MEKPIISIRNMHKWFPGVHALNNVQLDLYAGEVHALMGENGAGKSTLIKIIAGVHDYTEGEYYFKGEKSKIKNPAQAIDEGISVIYQELNLVEGLSIAENIFFNHLPSTKSGKILWNQLYASTEEILKELQLNISPKTKIEYLSTAQKQLIEIGKALSHNAKVIIMDEPTSALAPKEIESLFKIIIKLKEKGVAIVYVSHKLDEIFRITDKITMFRDGQFIETRNTSEYDNNSIIEAMVGRELVDMYPKTERSIGEKILEVNNLVTEKVKDSSFHIHKGEIVGFSGLMGAGRSEVARAIFGVDKVLGGEIIFDGKKITNNSPTLAKKLGIGFLTEDRKLEGILGNMTVGDNITISYLYNYKKLLKIDKISEQSEVDQQIKALGIKTPSSKQLIAKLSGGNQQKALLARWLVGKNLKLLIIDEPTRGIDVGAKSEIYSIMNQLTERGISICMMSSELPELLGVCDRIYVMRAGKVVSEHIGVLATQEKLIKDAVG